MTNKVPICDECGSELKLTAAGMLCPRCLFGMGVRMARPENNEPLKESTDTPSTRPQQSRRFGDYELLNEIARGGMGVVYRARQISLDRIVAVKMLLFGQFSSNQFVRRFQAEAEAAAALQHPNIVAIHEIGEHEGQPYFSMDFIEGRDLAQVVAEKPMTSREAAGHLRTLAQAVHYAHQRGVLHRDLKPSNVLIDSSGHPRLTDFGLAKRFENGASLSASGQIIGSPSYMPPEQAAPQRGAVSPASDVYSLGAILYHLVTGRAPFVADSLEGTVMAVLHAEPIAPRLLNNDVPRDVETICLKCLQKNPLRRYASAEALADDLHLYLSGEPIRARPIGAVEKLGRWCHRKPGAAATIGLLLLMAAGSALMANHLSRLHQNARWNNYVSEMSRAQHEWQQHNFAESFFHLQRHIPNGNGPDQRGFEWRHLWKLSRGNCSSRLPRHPDVVGWLGFSPDSRMLATFRWDATNNLQVWDVENRRSRWQLHDATSVGGFSSDGEIFAAGTADNSIAAYHPATGRPLLSMARAGEIVAFAAEAKYAVTMDTNRVLAVRALASRCTLMILTNAARRTFDAGKGAPVAITPDGRWLALIRAGDPSDPKDSGIEIWSTDRGQMKVFLPHPRQIRTIQFSPDGGVLAIADGGGAVLLWSWNRGERQSLQAHDLPIQSLAFSADGRVLATGGTDETIRLWDLCTMQRKTAHIEGQIGAVWALSFSPDQKLLAAGSRDMPINLWNLEQIQRPAAITNLNAEKVGNFAFSPDAKLMSAGCKDDCVRVWAVDTLWEMHCLRGVNQTVAFTRSGRQLLVADAAGLAQWWDLKTGTLRPVPSYGRLGEITCVDFSPDREAAALGYKTGRIQLVSVRTGDVLGVYEGHRDAVLSVAFAPDGLKFASASRDKDVRIWDVAITNRSRQVCREHKGAVAGLAISKDGRMMASGCSANTIKFWDLRHLEKSMGSRSWHRAGIRSLAFSPDGQRLASGSDDHSVKLWDFGTRRELAAFEFEAGVQLVAFSPDARHLAVVTERGALHLLQTVTLDEADQEIRELYQPATF